MVLDSLAENGLAGQEEGEPPDVRREPQRVNAFPIGKGRGTGTASAPVALIQSGTSGRILDLVVMVWNAFASRHEFIVTGGRGGMCFAMCGSAPRASGCCYAIRLSTNRTCETYVSVNVRCAKGASAKCLQ